MQFFPHPLAARIYLMWHHYQRETEGGTGRGRGSKTVHAQGSGPWFRPPGEHVGRLPTGDAAAPAAGSSIGFLVH